MDPPHHTYYPYVGKLATGRQGSTSPHFLASLLFCGEVRASTPQKIELTRDRTNLILQDKEARRCVRGESHGRL
jgi:hypothetical protein